MTNSVIRKYATTKFRVEIYNPYIRRTKPRKFIKDLSTHPDIHSRIIRGEDVFGQPIARDVLLEPLAELHREGLMAIEGIALVLEGASQVLPTRLLPHADDPSIIECDEEVQVIRSLYRPLNPINGKVDARILDWEEKRRLFLEAEILDLLEEKRRLCQKDTARCGKVLSLLAQS